MNLSMSSFRSLFVFVYLIISNGLMAQDQPKRYVRILLSNRSEIFGMLMPGDERTISVLLPDSTFKAFDRSDVLNMITVDKEDMAPDGSYQPYHSDMSYGLFATNALPNRKKQVSMIIHLYGPELTLNLKKGFNFSFMTTWCAMPLGVSLTKTFGAPFAKSHFSIKNTVMNSSWLTSFMGWYGCHTAGYTLGSEKRNITFRAGYLWYEAGFKEAKHVSADPGDYPVSTTDYNTLFKSRGPLFQSPTGGISGFVKGSKLSFLFEVMAAIRMRHDKYVQLREIGGVDYYHVAEDIFPTSHIYLSVGIRKKLRSNHSIQFALPVFAYFSPESRSINPLVNMTWFVTLKSGRKVDI